MKKIFEIQESHLYANPILKSDSVEEDTKKYRLFLIRNIMQNYAIIVDNGFDNSTKEINDFIEGGRDFLRLSVESNRVEDPSGILIAVKTYEQEFNRLIREINALNRAFNIK